MTVTELAYLRDPEKIRVALINMGGPRLSVSEVKRQLKRLPENKPKRVADYQAGDAIDYTVPRIGPQPNRKTRFREELQKERDRIAALASGIPDRPEPPREVRYRKPTKPVVQPSTQWAEKLVDTVCERTTIHKRDLLGPYRNQYLVAARALVAVLCRERSETVYSYPRIAPIIGRTDHSTVINLVDRFPYYCKEFPAIARLYEDLRDGEE